MPVSTCREVHTLLGPFFDKELDQPQMRAIALHSAECERCEAELRGLELLQGLVSRALNAQVDQVDLSGMWARVEPRLKPRRMRRLIRLHSWWSDLELAWTWGVPAFGAVAAVAALLALSVWRSPVDNPENPVSVHEITSDDHVALVNESDTVLLWIDHELGSPGLGAPDFDALDR